MCEVHLRECRPEGTNMYLKISDETPKDSVLQHVIKAIKYLKKTKIPSFYLKENKRRSNRKQNELTIYQDEND